MPRAAQQIRGIQTYRRLHLPLAYASSLSIVLHQDFRIDRSQIETQVSLVLRLTAKKLEFFRVGKFCPKFFLTEHLTARAYDGHAPPLSVSSTPFRRTFILLSLLVRFWALNPIEPQHSPLVVFPRLFL